jgi:hypothetical protein
MKRVLAGGLVVVALALAWSQQPALSAWAFSVTGEEQPLSQIRGMWHVALSLLRPPLDLQAERPIRHNGVNPFGINTFLQQEVEPQKREQQLRLIAAAGFGWIRQEFPWADLEIAGKDDFSDCRNQTATGGCISAWDKYDQIVGLAEQYDITIIARLSSPPAWSRADGEARGAFGPPDDPTDFADFAEAVARRYTGRLHYYQIWNEPNIFPEWGDQPADPEAFTALMCAAYDRLKAVDPAIVVLGPPLAPTLPLGLVNAGTSSAAELNDFVYLERMYQAGAGRCFDIQSVQGYGLGSGPTDQRMRPLQFNYARNLFIRDLMVQHGDADKPIWIAEMNWNAAPEDIPTIFGRVSDEQQARYVPLAYERAQEDWPWVGVVMFWFFKRASDAERDQAWYYFRMADPDFTLRPVYHTMKAYIAGARFVGAGWFQEDHWAIDWEGWVPVSGPAYTFEGAMQGRPGSQATVVVRGASLRLEVLRGPTAGQLEVSVDGGPPERLDLRATHEHKEIVVAAPALGDGAHTVTLRVVEGQPRIDGLIVRRDTGLAPLGLAGVVLLGLVGLRVVVGRRTTAPATPKPLQADTRTGADG